ncbi:MAG: Nucleoside triphosphate pyrophosphohydrolase [Candidatus Anoxychlamydiales bacterium]|nr:Nucleoside triphosphate pyrophosphohydrolase [Candidatus Anoxychlamydiales bacterium]NGX40839.1 Nucleoside triphosphate pyrophosphohydrolase [Candidatus Anoxychlamydiales bacterium]
MDKFNYLLEITSQLLGPDGCEWDRKQTFESIKKYFIEEVYELIDAIESKDDQNILEEAGDVFFLVVFLTKIAETKNKFKIDEVIQNITDKIIRRHPHVFSDVKVRGIEDIIDNWNKIKKTEKNKSKRKSLFDSVPKSMPLLLKAQKIIKILDSKKLLEYKKNLKTQKEIEDALLELVIQAELNELDVELLLKNKLKILLDNFDKKITGDDLKALKIDS